MFMLEMLLAKTGLMGISVNKRVCCVLSMNDATARPAHGF